MSCSRTQHKTYVESRTRELSCADLESFVRGGPNLITFFLVNEGMEDPNIALNGPSSAHQQNAIEMAFCWRADDGLTLNAQAWLLCDFSGDPDQYCKKTVYFSDFLGGGPDHLSPLWIRPCPPPPPPPPPPPTRPYSLTLLPLCQFKV